MFSVDFGFMFCSVSVAGWAVGYVVVVLGLTSVWVDASFSMTGWLVGSVEMVALSHCLNKIDGLVWKCRWLFG